jgi:Bax protein
MRVLLALLFPIAIAIAALLAFLAPHNMDTRLHLQRLEVKSVAELETAFEKMGYSWPPSEVPAIELKTFPLDLADISDAKQRKSLFFRALLPIVLVENSVIKARREQVIALFDEGVEHLNSAELNWLKSVAEQYEVEGELTSPKTQQQLLHRVDIVPPALVLAQAANESGWGTSRFALAGNNLFGQYTYQQADGIVPLNRREGETHALRAYDSLDDSVRSYIHNLNTNNAYNELRNLRQQMRSNGKPLSSQALAAGLEGYSERGAEYVADIQAMIRSNKLPVVLDGVSLAD